MELDLSEDLRRYDIDPILLCRCGVYQSGDGMVEVLGGRYVEADAALARIEALEALVIQLGA